MNSKTPKFDKALDEYFAGLELDEKGGQWRTCRFSGEKFYVRPEDIEFYKRMRVPLPTLLPRERTRNILAFYNTYNLFKIESAYSGKEIVACYPPTTPHRIYEHQIWFGGDWDAQNYARPYDKNKSFFEQFKVIKLEVPKPNLYVDSTCINSDYTNNSNHLKNCYLVFDSFQVEDSAYSVALNSRNVYDSFTPINCDTCYDCFESSDLWHCFYAEYSQNCRECRFILDCRDCENCFGCINLRHKKYCFFNKQLNKEEYEKKVAALNLGDRKVVEEVKKKFSELKESAFYKENHNERAVNCYGEYLKDSRNCYACFYMIGGESLGYCTGGIKIRDSYDIIGGDNSEFCYYSSGGENNYGIRFSFGAEYSRDMEYCDSCLNSHNCFGCAGLKNKSFCIFNQQYSEGDYWQLVDEIKTEMLKSGEYGEFFPPVLSAFPYNISLATSYKGYGDVDNARKYGYLIEETVEQKAALSGALPVAGLPGDIKEVSEEIINKPLLDGEHGRTFRVIKPELDFYKKYGIPLPLHHPSERIAAQRMKFGPILFELYERKCAKCGKEIKTSYAPARPEKNIYCEECYLKAVV